MGDLSGDGSWQPSAGLSLPASPLCSDSIALWQLWGLPGTLCKLLFGVQNQSWLHGRATRAGAPVPALRMALCWVQGSAAAVSKFLTLSEHRALRFRVTFLCFRFVCGSYCWSCLPGLALRFQEDRTAALLSCWWHVWEARGGMEGAAMC